MECSWPGTVHSWCLTVDCSWLLPGHSTRHSQDISADSRRIFGGRKNLIWLRGNACSMKIHDECWMSLLKSNLNWRSAESEIFTLNIVECSRQHHVTHPLAAVCANWDSMVCCRSSRQSIARLIRLRSRLHPPSGFGSFAFKISRTRGFFTRFDYLEVKAHFLNSGFET